MYQCRKCCRVIYRRNCPKELHVCYTTKCPSCEKFVVASEHRCYLRRIEPKTASGKIIYFDLETDQETGEHVVNFAVAQYTDGRQFVFKDYNACDKFCSWLFSPKHKGYTAIAHNMKGYVNEARFLYFSIFSYLYVFIIFFFSVSTANFF